jgi:hypothetical protein
MFTLFHSFTNWLSRESSLWHAKPVTSLCMKAARGGKAAVGTRQGQRRAELCDWFLDRMPGKIGVLRQGQASEKVLDKLYVPGIDKFCFVALSLPFALSIEVVSPFALPHRIDGGFPLVSLSAVPCGQGLRIG